MFWYVFVVIHDYTLRFTVSTCCTSSYYNYISIWPYYVVIHFTWLAVIFIANVNEFLALKSHKLKCIHWKLTVEIIKINHTSTKGNNCDRSCRSLTSQKCIFVYLTGPLSYILQFCSHQKQVLRGHQSYSAVLLGIHIQSTVVIFKLPFHTVRDTKLQSFQFRLLHRIIPCNKWLNTIKIKNSYTTLSYKLHQSTWILELLDKLVGKHQWNRN